MRQTKANLEQISAHTAVILTDLKVDNGCRVSFLIQRNELKGRVVAQTCDQRLGNFLTVELDNLRPWSPEWFRPEHLLCVDALPQVTATAA